MADYIYTLETRLSPDQQKAIALVSDAAKAAEMNLYLTGGAIRDIVTGFPTPRSRLRGAGQRAQAPKRPGEGGRGHLTRGTAKKASA